MLSLFKKASYVTPEKQLAILTETQAAVLDGFGTDVLGYGTQHGQPPLSQLFMTFMGLRMQGCMHINASGTVTIDFEYTDKPKVTFLYSVRDDLNNRDADVQIGFTPIGTVMVPDIVTAPRDETGEIRFDTIEHPLANHILRYAAAYELHQKTFTPPQKLNLG